jgi:hypothetical protein
MAAKEISREAKKQSDKPNPIHEQKKLPPLPSLVESVNIGAATPVFWTSRHYRAPVTYSISSALCARADNRENTSAGTAQGNRGDE